MLDQGLGALADRPVHNRALQKALERGEPVRMEAQSVKVDGKGVEMAPFAAVPILKGEERLGVIEVDRRSTSAPIEEDDLNTILSFGMQAAIAISDSQMKEDLPTWEAALDDVLRDYRTD